MTSDPKIWLGAILTLASFSWVIKENAAYMFCERLLIGLGAGYAMVVGVDNIISAGIRPLSTGNAWRILPLLLGALLITSLVPSLHRNRTIPNIFIIAIGTGLVIRSVMQSQFILQIAATWVMPNSLNNLILILGTFGAMMYFVFTFFTKEYTGVAGGLKRGIREIGLWVLMVNFGASFGTAVQARLSTFADRLVFLLTQWITVFK